METRKVWNWRVARRSLIAPALAIAVGASVAAFEIAKPAIATAAAATPAASAAPLDDNSVSALLSLDKAMETLAARVTPAVVNVAVTSRAKAEPVGMSDNDDQQQLPDDIQRFFDQFGNQFGGHGGQFGQRMQPQIEHGIGSGVLISPDGYIVTNNHVVNGAVDIRVTTSDKRVWPAKLIGTDPLTDLAVIKVNGTNLPSLPLGDSNKLHPGQTVLAFGNPMGLRFTVTRGIVSALNRANPFSDDAHKPGGFIQTDAAINPGNSGGALVDARGEVVGINTFLISSSGGFSGMGFAIPSETVRPVVDSLIQHGKVEHAHMGVGITDVTSENAKFFKLNDNVGAVVTQVEPDSPGAKAGLKTGDVIRGVNGKEVSDATQLQMAIVERQPDTTVTLDVLRDGKSMKVPVTLAAMDNSNKARAGATDEHGKARWGIGLAEMTPEVRQQLQVPDEIHGAVIANVQPGSPADNSGLSRGDVIVQVDRHDVQNPDDVQRELTKVPKGEDALVLVWSHGGNSFRVLHSPDVG